MIMSFTMFLVVQWCCHSVYKNQASVVRTLDSAIHRINHYPVDSLIGFPKGVFTWHQGDFRAGVSLLWFPLMALHLFMWYHHKMSCQSESPRGEFTAGVVPGQEFHSEISQRYHVNTKQPLVSVWNRSAGRLERKGIRNVCDFESYVYFISMKCTFK